MEHTESRRGPRPYAVARRHAGAVGFCVAALLFLALTPHVVVGGETTYKRHTRENFRFTLGASVRADHPAIAPVAAAIRAVTTNPLEQVVMVNDVTHLLVDYDDDDRVYSTPEFHATLDEMIARRRQGGWLYLRDDCDGRAVFAAHLLAALGISWRLEASYWKEHAWVITRINGVDYDLLDLRLNAPETDRVSYKLFGRFFVKPSRRPPAFAWRRAWAERTRRDLQVGLNLGMLAIDSTPGHLHQRFSTDWTEKAPDAKTTPADDRLTGATSAGFPYGEPLQVEAIAGEPTIPVPTGVKLGVSTGGK
jgi:hypothetical protein